MRIYKNMGTPKVSSKPINKLNLVSIYSTSQNLKLKLTIFNSNCKECYVENTKNLLKTNIMSRESNSKYSGLFQIKIIIIIV